MDELLGLLGEMGVYNDGDKDAERGSNLNAEIFSEAILQPLS